MNLILERIKSRGHWRINFEPLVYPTNPRSLSECLQVVEKNAVSLRGWDYPTIPRRKEGDVGIFAGKNFYEGRENWNTHIEWWRIYQSGQFLHYVALSEDWAEYGGWGITEKRELAPGSQLNIIGGVVYQLTEIFEFLSRLAQNGLYEEGVRVSLTLQNTKGRRLTASFDRMLSDNYITSLPDISYERVCSKEEMVTKGRELAMEAIIHFFERFNWINVPRDVFRNDQERLLNRRL